MVDAINGDSALNLTQLLVVRRGDTFSIYWEQLLKVLKISNLLVASKKSNISVVDV